eukprot:831337-Rhodomonas_salina.4
MSVPRVAGAVPMPVPSITLCNTSTEYPAMHTSTEYHAMQYRAFHRAYAYAVPGPHIAQHTVGR